MAVYQDLVDYDELFSKADLGSVLLVNDFDPELTGDRDLLIDQMVTRHEGDSLSVIPTCFCGETHGATRQGKICRECGTVVEQSTDRTIESTLWMKAPDETPGFIHPALYNILKSHFRVSGCDIIDWLCRSPTVSGFQNNKAVERLKLLGFKRGLNAFHEQFDMFLAEGFHSDICGGSNRSKKERMQLREFLTKHRHLLFCRYLPLPSRIAFMVEEEATRSFVDKNVYKCVDAVNTILGIKVGQPDLETLDDNGQRAQQRRIEDRTFMAGSQLSAFYLDFNSETLGKKTGWYRKHVYGSRLNFTFRGVITSIFEPHHYEALHLPWSIGVNIFALHIINKLLKLGYTPRAAGRLIAICTNVYSPLLDQLMQEIIAEHPMGKFPVIFQRNPTLARLSAQCLYITAVKTDPEDRSISMGLLVLAGCNADFDGKQHCRR